MPTNKSRVCAVYSSVLARMQGGQYPGMLIAFTLLALVGASLPSHAQSNMTMYFVHNDHLGTPNVITNQDQEVVWRAEKRPFGETAVEGVIEEHFRFPGQTFDGESGLAYNYHRYYDPGTGRYITSDPIGLRGGLNTYGYVLANPLNAIDRYGHSTTILPWIPALTRPLPMSPIDPVLPIPDIPGNPTFPGEPPDPFSNKCRSLSKKIQNLRDEIHNKRYPALDSNPGDLPWRIGPGEKLKETVRGHEKLLNRRLRELREAEDEYANRCSPLACLGPL